MRFDLGDHLRFVHMHDIEFIEAWGSTNATHRGEYQRLWLSAENTRLRFTQYDALQNADRVATDDSRSIVGSITELEFQRQPKIDEWIAAATDGHRTQKSLQLWREQLEPFVHSHRLHCTYFYGGLKPAPSLNEKLNAYMHRGARPDLWDNIRFRIVVKNLYELAHVANSFKEQFNSSLIRCRNYYEHSRCEQNDPYRGIHFELESGSYEFVEIQMLTSMREAVGLLDHSLKHKRTLQFQSSGHRQWLRDFSAAANILDTEMCGATTRCPANRTAESFSITHVSGRGPPRR